MSQTDNSWRRWRRALGEGMARDYPRLRRDLDRAIAQGGELPPALQQAIEASAHERAQRAARVPAIVVPEELPIAAHAERIVSLLRQHQVVVVAGETGSGKTTQLPKLCLAAGRGQAGLIGCTQPRRIAAKSIARRVASELKQPELVGFEVRFQDQTPAGALIKFMTDGILLAETQSDRALRRYDTLILDEAHERSLNIDFLLGYLKRLLPRRPDLKLVVTSATIDTERFARHFRDAPVVSVEGRGYPVEMRYRPLSGDREERADRALYAGIAQAVEELSREDPRGDVLVFLPGEREIRDAHLDLEKRRYAHTEILPLYARLSGQAQDRVFQPGPLRRIVLATNVAETSLTVPRIRFVIDTGTARINRYSHRAKVQRLQIEPISQASANQRAGRCGRTSPGICVRLFDEQDFARRPAYTDPELLRSSLAGVILRMLELELGDPLEFPFLDPPSERSVRDGYALLAELGAIEESRRLTPIGKAMACWPIDVRLARFLLDARERGVLAPALVIASALSIQDPRERPSEARALADAAHQAYAHERSDFLGLCRLWQAYTHEHEKRTQNQLREWCKTQFLSYLRMREWRELHRQLLLLARNELRWPIEDAHLHEPDPREEEALHRALLTAFVTQVARKEEKQRYRGPRSRTLTVFPGSALARSAPPWLMSATLLETDKLYALTCARIEAAWIEPAAAHLLKRRCYDPFWDAKAGRVYGYEDLDLFGLLIVQRRRIAYASVDPAACRELFLRHQCVLDEGPIKHPLLAHNAHMREEAKAKEEKLRRRGLLRDSEELLRWFDARIPAEIIDSHAWLKWLRSAPAEQVAALKLSIADLVVPEAVDDERSLYPDTLKVEGGELALSYRFDPRGERDGVTVRVPLAALMPLRTAQLDWLVPGLREDKAVALIKGLPKALRRHFVPAPDFARAFLEAVQPGQGSFAEALAGFLHKITGVEIQASDFAGIELPTHLRLHLVVLDAAGMEVSAGDDLAALQGAHAAAAQRAFAERVDRDFHRDGLSAWPLDSIPVEVAAEGGARAYPALVDQGQAVGLHAYAQPDEAAAAHVGGVRRLLVLHLDDVLRYWRRQLPLSRDALLAYGVIEAADSLRADLVDSALDAVIAETVGGIRTRQAFLALAERVRKELGGEATRRAGLVDRALQWIKPIRQRLAPPLMGYAAANLQDVRSHLDSLVYPGFVKAVPAAALTHYPRYLEALHLRLERLLRDPTRDQARLLEVQPYARALQRASERLGRHHPKVEQLRWLIEEWRVSLYAQELKTAEPVSAKRLAKMVETIGV